MQLQAVGNNLLNDLLSNLGDLNTEDFSNGATTTTTTSSSTGSETSSTNISINSPREGLTEEELWEYMEHTANVLEGIAFD